jgi:glycosyltransferase involved in cell wall biosynthesis
MFTSQKLITKPGVTFLLPCLNEAETIEKVVNEIKEAFEGVSEMEILISDNGSKDGSISIATALGCRVIHTSRKGYGSALINGISASRHQIIVMGDADGSYNFADSIEMISKIHQGYDLVMGNRFFFPMEKGAMPFLNKYLGNPVLSLLGRVLFKVRIKDFHCGLRAFKKRSIETLNLQSPGMEFASEMVLKASLANLKLGEVPIHFRKDGRSRRPHLRPWRDGWRHLILLFLFSPRYLFAVPALLLLFTGFLIGILGNSGSVNLGSVDLGYRTSVLVAALSILSSLLYGIHIQLHLAQLRLFNRISKKVVFKSSFHPYLFMIIGAVIITFDFMEWKDSGFGTLELGQDLLWFTWGVSLLGVGLVQLLLKGFFRINDLYSRHIVPLEN